MKFSSTTLLALSFNSGAWFALGKVPISRYEMLAAGDGTEASPYGEVLSLDPFNGKVFIEAHNQTFGVSGTPITIELFANVTANVSCNEGTLLANSSKNSISTDYYKYEGAPAAYTPTTSDGIIGVADFSIQDFQGAGVGIFTVTPQTRRLSGTYGTYKYWIPDLVSVGVHFSDSKTVGTYGTINLCVRTSIKMQIDGGSNYVSFVDSHLKVNVDLASDFKTFNQSVTIVATDAQTQEETIVKSVDVESFLCEKNGADTNTTKYKIGQDFSVCVRPTAGYISDYNVAGFSNVTCGYRTLVSNGQVGPLTEVAAGNSTQGNVASFTSVVISGYFDGGQTSFTCSGTAVLSYLGRRLATSFSHAFLDTQDSFRGLQESTIPEEIPFATSIQLLNDNLDIEGIAAPAFTASHGGWNLFIVCAAVVIASVI
eukprot:CAMPEP_0168245410 /NCGR_PEP_ID=MMETSP0140_2-20121125/25150_1 /TAXON_ID=44445 /ORGANISM="Pseudo-nitzschia australis, Strain 10249 10 AB" /LENGTH=426 /DNA_ID=CAMNT_0008180999 /DNA_START=824 /DNA_END=2105 /DNA_ORIENTATION=+